ncbi:hypothetical protein HYT59_01640 [Candidatus Woesebacteria bacterium]|nr:hypothetical protein [Candidatus Woesebacteria bacterium]
MANVPIEELVAEFLKKGGRINKYYLSDLSRSRPSLVYLRGWYGGANIRIAINKALSAQ